MTDTTPAVGAGQGAGCSSPGSLLVTCREVALGGVGSATARGAKTASSQGWEN